MKLLSPGFPLLLLLRLRLRLRLFPCLFLRTPLLPLLPLMRYCPFPTSTPLPHRDC
jgi:hypothetical protein